MRQSATRSITLSFAVLALVVMGEAAPVHAQYVCQTTRGHCRATFRALGETCKCRISSGSAAGNVVFKRQVGISRVTGNKSGAASRYPWDKTKGSERDNASNVRADNANAQSPASMNQHKEPVVKKKPTNAVQPSQKPPGPNPLTTFRYESSADDSQIPPGAHAGGQLAQTDADYDRAAPQPEIQQPRDAAAGTNEVSSKPPDAILPEPSNEILTTRDFLGPHDIPPVKFAAYGIVAFPQKAISATLQRYMWTCQAFVASLPPVSSTLAPVEKQMVTVWPVDNSSLAARLNDQGEAVCKEAVEHYDLSTGLIAIKEARTQERIGLSGEGPYLLAWAPSSLKGQKGAIVLIADLSSATTPQHFLSYFQKWREDIEQNPSLWRTGGWSEATLITVIRNWADKWGPLILSTGHAEYNKGE
jgi:hypothetical protein